MTMVAWMIAALATLVALALAGVALSMRAARQRWEERFRHALQASRDLQTKLEEQRGTAMLGALAGDLGSRLQPSVVPMSAKPDPHTASAAALLARYRQLVTEYDHAVQYCLQPVDLIAGADNAGVEQLLRQVTGARRRLFQARSALMQSPVPAELSALFIAPVSKPDHAAQLAAALGKMAAGSSARAKHAPTDVNTLLEAALVLTQARGKHARQVIKQLDSLPPLGPAPWLGPALLQMLHCASAAAGPGGRLIARTVALAQRIEVHIIGHMPPSARNVRQISMQSDASAPIAEMQQQLYEHGASLIEMSGHEHGLGLVLRLPVRIAAVAA